jgi:hypothetical protein
VTIPPGFRVVPAQEPTREHPACATVPAAGDECVVADGPRYGPVPASLILDCGFVGCARDL